MVVQRAVAKCSPTGISKLYEDASPERKELLRASVFGGIFQMPKGVSFVGDVVDSMLSFWVEKNHFRIGKRDVYLLKMDIALILGLPVVEPQQYTPSVNLPEKKTIRYKYFRGLPTGKIIRSHIENGLRLVESDDDFVKLALLFVLCTFLFPGSHHQLSEDHLQLVDAVENFAETPWGLYVYHDLMEYIEKGVTNRKAACKDKALKTYNIYGCMCVLQWWAYEMLPAISPNRTPLKNSYPRLLKWGERAQTMTKGYTRGKMLDSKIYAPLEPDSLEMEIPLLRDYQRGRKGVGGKRKVVVEEVKKAVEVDMRPKKKRNYIPIKEIEEEEEFEDQTTLEENSSSEEVPVQLDGPRTRDATKRSGSAPTSSNEVLLRRIDGMTLENLKLNQKVGHLEELMEQLIEENKLLKSQITSFDDRLISRDVELQTINHSNKLIREDQGKIIELLQTILELTPKSYGRVRMAVAVNVSRFEGVTMAPPDPILGVSEAFKADISDMKLNLGVGAYRTEELQPYVLKVVKKAENLMLEKGENKEYLPIEGLAAFNKATAELLFGADNAVIQQGRVATVQGLSGTGSLRLAAAFIERYFPGAKVLISAPTWGNHKNIFNDARVPWSEYRYYDPKTVGLDFDGMIADIKAAPDGSFVLLHGCAHNPTGIDPTPTQWEKIVDVIQEKNHIPFFDVAYQGFASGSLDEDASSVRLFVARGLELLVAQSYSKNLGLYAERIGAINVVCSSADAATRVKSQLKRIARPMYSNPPIHGAKIVANVVGDPSLFDDWKEEMELMAGRIQNVRQRLFDSLSEKDKSGKDWSFILKQIGMFSFTGLNKSQSDNMTDKWHVYMTKDGRISLAGLSLAKCQYLADAIIDSFHNVS